MSPAGFKPVFPASKKPKNLVLERASSRSIYNKLPAFNFLLFLFLMVPTFSLSNTKVYFLINFAYLVVII
jgi:hypothetical protein